MGETLALMPRHSEHLRLQRPDPERERRAAVRRLLFKLATEQDIELTCRRLRGLTPAYRQEWDDQIEWAERWKLLRLGSPHFRLTWWGKAVRALFF